VARGHVVQIGQSKHILMMSAGSRGARVLYNGGKCCICTTNHILKGFDEILRVLICFDYFFYNENEGKLMNIFGD